MKVVRFLERENVIRFFGLGLMLAPFINMGLHLFVLKTQNKMAWSQVNFAAYLKSGNPISYFLAACSVIIGIKMLGGTAKAWRYVLFLIGAHLLIQIVNVNNKAWQGPLAWPSFLLNAGLFFFIVDQLVWKVKAPEASVIPPVVDPPTPLKPMSEKQVVNLRSYRKILFSFGSDKPWGELKTLSSEELCVKSFAAVPSLVEHKIVQINFSKDVVIEIEFARKENEMYYFRPLNMQKENVTRLNKWLRKIAV
ncbi:hypothetical protein K2P97_08520 [bacterium]|nr:hypothetical protein [bacterium]